MKNTNFLSYTKLQYKRFTNNIIGKNNPEKANGQI